MQVEALYDHGRLEFTRPLQLRHERLRLIVEIPDEELITPMPPTYNLPLEVFARAQAMRDTLDAIRNAPLPPDDELPELTEKQRERIAAFALREDH
jgi:hypothetical protein